MTSRRPPAWLLGAIASVAIAGDKFEIDYFTVKGRTSRELSAAIDAQGPVGDDGRRSDGYTRWSIRWTLGLETDANGCRVGGVDVDLDIRMTLPRWTPPAATDPELVARWNRYLAAVRAHEDGHRQRAEVAAAELRRALQRGDSAPDCQALTNRLDARANAMLDELRREQAAYDRATRFGAKQGVRRP